MATNAASVHARDRVCGLVLGVPNATVKMPADRASNRSNPREFCTAARHTPTLTSLSLLQAPTRSYSNTHTPRTAKLPIIPRRPPPPCPERAARQPRRPPARTGDASPRLGHHRRWHPGRGTGHYRSTVVTVTGHGSGQDPYDLPADTGMRVPLAHARVDPVRGYHVHIDYL